MPVYKVHNKAAGTSTYVLANNIAQAIRHVAESVFDTAIVRSQQIAELVTRPNPPVIERATEYKDRGPETQDLPLQDPSAPDDGRASTGFDPGE